MGSQMEFPHDDRESGITDDEFVELVELDALIAPFNLDNPPRDKENEINSAISRLHEIAARCSIGSNTQRYIDYITGTRNRMHR